jgi:hypothetical protein
MAAMSAEGDAALVIKTGIEQMFVPLHQLLDKLLGPAATEVGLSLSDSVKVWRLKRQVRLLQEVKRLLEHTDKDIKPIATRLFFPILEAASIEDDDEMQTRWASLLANEATDAGSLHPSYIDILRQLSPSDAQLLDKLCGWCDRNKTQRLTRGSSLFDQEIHGIFESHGDSLENLIRLGLIQSEYEVKDVGRGFKIIGGQAIVNPGEFDSWYQMPDFSLRFVRACRAPTTLK